MKVCLIHVGGALLTVALASPAAEAQTEAVAAKQSAVHARAKHRVAMPKEEGRQITVRNATPSWLTLGPGARAGSGHDYMTETLDQPSAVEGTFAGYRGRERLDSSRFSGPGLPLFKF